jgi:hypothetical protein
MVYPVFQATWEAKAGDQKFEIRVRYVIRSFLKKEKVFPNISAQLTDNSPASTKALTEMYN